MPRTMASSTLSTGNSRPDCGCEFTPRPRTSSASRFHLGTGALLLVAISDFELRIANCECRISNCPSAESIRNSRFAIRNSQIVHCLLEHPSSVLVVVKHIEARASGCKQHDVALDCGFHRLKHGVSHRPRTSH